MGDEASRSPVAGQVEACQASLLKDTAPGERHDLATAAPEVERDCQNDGCLQLSSSLCASVADMEMLAGAADQKPSDDPRLLATRARGPYEL